MNTTAELVGWHPGWPPHLTVEAAIELASRYVSCPRCEGGRVRVQPWHIGSACRLTLTCRDCGHRREVPA